jgi:hypothetical protein
MKKTMTKMLAVAFMVMVIIQITGCKKGDTGPAGPTGATGATGAQGTQGNQGNANVSSRTIIANAADWVSTSTSWYVDLFPSNITQLAVDSGTVMVYMESTTQAGTWLNMPWIEEISSSYFSTFNYVYAAGTVRISKYDSDLTMPTPPGLRKFKIVAIPPHMKKANINYSNYNEVKSAYNL